jgi:MFS family permease
MQTEKGHNLILLLVYIKHVIFQLTFFYFPIYLNDNGFSGFQIGILMSIFSITGLIILFPAGILNDRFLSRSLLFISFLIGALCYFGILVSNIFIVMAIIFFFLGVNNNLSTTSFNSLIYKTINNSKAKALGNLTFARSLGSASGLLISSIILLKLGFNLLFVIAALLSIILALFCLNLPKTKTKFVSILQYKTNFLRKEVIFFAIIMFLNAIHWGAEHTVYSLFLKNNLNLGWLGMGIYMSIPIIILAITAKKIGIKLSKKKDFNSILTFGLLFSGTGHILMSITPLAISFSFRILHEIGDAMIMVVMLVGIAKLLLSLENTFPYFSMEMNKTTTEGSLKKA